MNTFGGRATTRSPETDAKYLYCYQNLRRRFIEESGQPDLSPEEVVAKLILRKPEYTMRSWRYNKNAVLCVLTERFPHLEAAIERLRGESSAGLPKTSAQTSGQKTKQVPTGFWRALQSSLRKRIANGYKHAQGLYDVLNATMSTGLRPNEWCTASIGIHAETGREVLHVINSKHSNGRANGPYRELFIDLLPHDERRSIEAAIAYCKADNEDDVARIQLALKNELETVRDQTLISRKEVESSITLYSFRHQFLANAKATFEDPVMIAALAGHNSTKTAFQHYGKRRNSTGTVRVFPTPESVEAVHKITLEIYKQFVAERARARRLDNV